MLKKTACIFITLWSASINAGSHTDACDSLLNLINSPTNSDSPCTVKAKEMVIELNYQYQQLFNGHQQYFPATELRFGLLNDNEWFITLPNYIYPSNWHSGFQTTITGLKHQLINNSQWVIAVETLLVLPGGSAIYGDKAIGVIFNGIIIYTLNSQWSLSGMMGATTQTDPRAAGGQRFNSLNPDWVLSYAPTEKIMTYVEVYGQSKTSAAQGAGFNIDEGLLLLFTPNIVLNTSITERLSGNLGGFERYISAGLAVKF